MLLPTSIVTRSFLGTHTVMRIKNIFLSAALVKVFVVLPIKINASQNMMQIYNVPIDA